MGRYSRLASWLLLAMVMACHSSYYWYENRLGGFILCGLAAIANAVTAVVTFSNRRI